MPGIRTAPDVTTTGSGWDVTFSMIDASGDLRTIGLRFPGGVEPADADIEAIAVALQDASNASLWRVTKKQLWEGTALASNGATVSYQSLYDNIVINYKNNLLRQQFSAYIPAPIAGIVAVGDVVTSDPLFVAYKDAVEDAVSGFTARKARFTERRDKNDATSL